MGHLYIAPYHVAGAEYVRKAAGQAEPDFAAYLAAVGSQEWLYDTGDDPAFFCFRRFVSEGGSLSWGICRPPVRNGLVPGDVVAFFGLRERERERERDEGVQYYFSGYATLSRKVCQVDIWRDPGLAIYRRYLNLLVRPDGDAFRWHESNPNKRQWHDDWLWRIAKRCGIRKADYNDMQKAGVLPPGLVDRNGRQVEVADNYVLFYPQEPLTYILAEPCLVGVYEKAWGAREEEWVRTAPADGIRALTIERSPHPRCLRTINVQRSHPHITVPLDVADWREEAYRTLLRCAECRPLAVGYLPQHDAP